MSKSKTVGFMAIALLFMLCTSSLAESSEDRLVEIENQLKELTEYEKLGSDLDL